jgi:hypothetical protein
VVDEDGTDCGGVATGEAEVDADEREEEEEDVSFGIASLSSAASLSLCGGEVVLLTTGATVELTGSCCFA